MLVLGQLRAGREDADRGDDVGIGRHDDLLSCYGCRQGPQFLDHDLGLFTGTEGDGLQVAKHLAARGFDGRNTFIHSTNQNGAAAMQGALKNATAVPFGQFEIESIGANA